MRLQHDFKKIYKIVYLLTLSDPRVSRRTGADPSIEELNVGDAAEPHGRGTGQNRGLILAVYIHFMPL